MNIGIIGANGFLGRSLCNYFLKYADFEVYGVYRNSSSKIPNGVHKLSSAVANTIKFDFLIIAIGNHSCGYKDYLEQYNFIQGVISNYLFDKIVYISSTDVYGKQEDVIKLNSSFNAPSVYGASKLCQEFLIKSLNNYTIIRPTYLYGNGMNSDSLLPIWIDKAKSEKDIVVYGDGQRKQDYLHVDDLCELCAVVLKSSKNDILIAASGNSITNKELAKKIINNINGVEIKFYGEDLTPSSFFDISETINAYDWSPNKTIDKWLIEEVLI